MISFDTIPSDIRTPGFYAEFDKRRALAGLPVVAQRILLVGQRLATGATPALTPVRIVTADDARVAFGRGSQAAIAFEALKAANDTTETWGIGLDDVGGGTLASGTVTVTGPAQSSGEIALMVNGTRLGIGVAAGASAVTISGAIVAAVAAKPDLPVTAAANGAGVVTFTARNKGTNGNDIDLRYSYYQGEAERFPLGVTLAVVAMAGGATNPDVSAVWAAIGDEPYSIFLMPYADTATLTSAEAEMARRSGPMVATDGIACFGTRGTFGTLAALGAARNSEFSSIFGAKGLPRSPSADAAAYYGVIAFNAAIDPSRPFQVLKVPGMLPPKTTDRFTRTERDLLLRDGISTFTVDRGGACFIERPISTYQTSPAGSEDPSWLDLNVPFALTYIRQVYRTEYQTTFPRHKLADDGNAFGAGQNIVTPRTAAAFNVSVYKKLVDAGICENIDAFKGDMIVERDATDRSRLNMLLPVRLVGQFRSQAVKIEYRL